MFNAQTPGQSIHSFTEQTLSSYHAPCSMLGARTTTKNKSTGPALRGLPFGGGGSRRQGERKERNCYSSDGKYYKMRLSAESAAGILG